MDLYTRGIPIQGLPLNTSTFCCGYLRYGRAGHGRGGSTNSNWLVWSTCCTSAASPLNYIRAASDRGCCTFPCIDHRCDQVDIIRRSAPREEKDTSHGQRGKTWSVYILILPIRWHAYTAIFKGSSRQKEETFHSQNTRRPGQKVPN